MLEAINLSKKYGGHQALIDFHLAVGPGEVFCLLGANGTSKTTTINLFMNFIQPSVGEVKIIYHRHDSLTTSINYIPKIWLSRTLRIGVRVLKTE